MTTCAISISGFLDFLRTYAGIPVDALPDNAPVIQMAYDTAVALVNLQILRVSPLLYSQAVYNLGTSNVFNFAPDVEGAPVIALSPDKSYPYFEAFRVKWNLLGFVGGTIDESHDETTGQHMVVPDQMKHLTIADLQYLKDPFGRQYLAIAQRAGALWGLT